VHYSESEDSMMRVTALIASSNFDDARLRAKKKSPRIRIGTTNSGVATLRAPPKI